MYNSLIKSNNDNIYSFYTINIENDKFLQKRFNKSKDMTFMLYMTIIFPDNIFMMFSAHPNGIFNIIRIYHNNWCKCSNITKLLGPNIKNNTIRCSIKDITNVKYKFIKNII